ncbi:TPA: hypothetical protein UOK25_000895 [Stenotrophomonas maltophilia]|nr:hypothetical protein [Stenotrophomonas maltophilia]
MKTESARLISLAATARLGVIKGLLCNVCGAPALSDTHHINKGQHFVGEALRKDWGQGWVTGCHGQKVIRRICKADELLALNVTLYRTGIEVGT